MLGCYVMVGVYKLTRRTKTILFNGIDEFKSTCLIIQIAKIHSLNIKIQMTNKMVSVYYTKRKQHIKNKTLGIFHMLRMIERFLPYQLYNVVLQNVFLYLTMQCFREEFIKIHLRWLLIWRQYIIKISELINTNHY